jgi:hypothetical protein
MPPGSNTWTRRRVWTALPPGAEDVLCEELSPTDLQSLLLDVAGTRAATVTPARVMRRWRDDRFVRPSATDPGRLATVEAQLWASLPGQFEGVELSPLTPFGTCAAMAVGSQDRIVTTMRGSEVVSDPTNVLAIEAASRRQGQARSGRVDLAASHRVVRAQAFDGPGLLAHFKLFALVSSARDRGSGLTEAEMLCDHLTFYAGALGRLLPDREVSIVVSTFAGGAVDERLGDLLPRPPAVAANVTVSRDVSRTHARGYYTSHAIKIEIWDGDTEVNLGDGGLTTWTALLTADAKERCMTSCISSERLAALLDR